MASVTLVLAMSLITVTACAESTEEQYARVIAERAAKIVHTMKLSDHEQRARVEAMITDQYRTLRDIHARRDAAGDDAARNVAKLELFAAHVRFLARLQAELDCKQVEQIKDGLTYGVMNHTYNGYLAKLPDLKDDEKQTIREFLLEARELAMDGGSADEKHEIFRKYKGKINNYLSAAGHKL